MPKSKVRKKAKVALAKDRRERQAVTQRVYERRVQGLMGELNQRFDLALGDVYDSPVPSYWQALRDVDHVLSRRPGWCFASEYAGSLMWHYHVADDLVVTVVGEGLEGGSEEGVRETFIVLPPGQETFEVGEQVLAFSGIDAFMGSLDAIEQYRDGSPAPQGGRYITY